MRTFVSALNRLLCGILTCGMCSHAAFAQMTREASYERERKTGVGPSVSSLSGLGLFKGLNRWRFIQGNIGFESKDKYNLTADYCFSYPELFSSNDAVSPFWGVGITQQHDAADNMSEFFDRDGPVDATGVRVPFGVNAQIEKLPLLVSMDVAPTMLVEPRSTSFVRGSVSLRVLF